MSTVGQFAVANKRQRQQDVTPTICLQWSCQHLSIFFRKSTLSRASVRATLRENVSIKLHETEHQKPERGRRVSRIFSELVDLSLDVVFAHDPQLLVKLGRYLVGAEVLHSLRRESTE